MYCIILAGGFATRLWPLTENKAKPLLTLVDRPLISHIVQSIPPEIPIVVSTNAVFRNAFSEWRKGFPNHPIEIFIEDSFSNESKKGALGATAMVIERKQLKEDLLLFAGDNYFGFSMPAFFQSFSKNPLLAAYDIKDVNKAKRFGVVVTRDGRVTEFQEKPAQPKSTLVSTGCYLFPAKNLQDIIIYSCEKNDDLGGVFEYLLRKGETINAFSFSDPWYDIGSFDAYLTAHCELLHGENKVAPQAIVQRSDLKGGVSIADGAHVERCTLENVMILSGSIVENCVIRNSIIDKHCHLKNLDISHKMIRQGSAIEKNL
ncbi:NDP-sugar synthase [Candidatus Peregrinibacteria bacterium]|nr:NDP-sugar synthase [Candidatus Peregrinibacteria bacterium]